LGQIKIPPKFKKIEFPKIGSEEWFLLNWSNLEYSVKKRSNKLDVSINIIQDEIEYKLSDGKLISTYNPGPNKFIFQPKDPLLKKIEIKLGNIVFIYSIKGEIFFIESIENDINHRGFVYKLERVGNQFAYKKVLEINDIPLAFLIHHNILYIATESSFISIRDMQITTLFKDAKWRLLFPNSIAYFNKQNIFLGLRAGIIRLNLKKHSIEFFESEDNKYNE
jgi:hypothetical protein